MKLLQQKLASYTEPQKAKAAGIYPYFRAISSEQDTEVIINGKKVLMFGSNCYSGLVNDPRVREAAIQATMKYGTGLAGSPFLNGTLDIHKDLEKKLAAYAGKEDAIVSPAVRTTSSGTSRTTHRLSRDAASRSRSRSNIVTTTWHRSRRSSRSATPTR